MRSCTQYCFHVVVMLRVEDVFKEMIPYSRFYLRGAISANIQFFSPAVMPVIIKSAKCKSSIYEPTASASVNSASPQRLA